MHLYYGQVKQLYRLTPNEIKDLLGVEKLLLKDENAIPNLTKFKYWYQKE
ncbi:MULTISPECIES: hypothetical protein [Bacillus cereus group]|nr:MULTISPECIES: hypothetical protein [Bacillus cereus group]